MITTGAITLSRLLVGNCTLDMLNVSGNAVGDEGVSVLVEQLQHILHWPHCVWDSVDYQQKVYEHIHKCAWIVSVYNYNNDS